MNAFELRRLRREGKDVILPGGFSAIQVNQNEKFGDAEKRFNLHFKEIKSRPKKSLGCHV